MRILIGCEFGGEVRDAFRRRGHDAVSCDLNPSEAGGPHIQCDVREVLNDGWDMLIAFPPCTYLTNSGVKHLYIGGRKENGRYEPRWDALQAGAEFFRTLWRADIPYIALENPVPHRHAVKIIGQRYTQRVQRHWFGVMEQKETCLWLKNLPPLEKTNDVYDAMMRLPRKERERCHYVSPGPNRWKFRSIIQPEFAEAMASQWGALQPL